MPHELHPGTAAALDGPAWLRAERTAAAQRAQAAGLPTPDEEIWRYSRIAELDLAAFRLADAPAQDVVPAERLAALRALSPAALVVTVDGHLVHLEVAPEAAAQGLSVAAPSEPGVLGSVMTTATDVFAEWNTALATAPVVVSLRAGRAVSGPVVVADLTLTDGAASFPRLVVQVGADAELTVLHQALGDDVQALTAPVVELHAAQAARLRYVTLQQLGSRVWQVGSVVASGERDSSTSIAAVALGGDYARQRIDARLVGQGASGEQLAVYFGEGTQMHDFRTLQDHVAPKTTSNLLFKGAVEGHAKSVYTGLIKVRPEARGTAAFQTNRNIKLSEGAWAESVPNLEIETNDVKCSHASAVGPIDEDQRFYLESRGVPPEVAERLIVLGFFDEVFDQLPVPDAIAPARAQVAAKLERREVV